jgi:hypothetical protein
MSTDYEAVCDVCRLRAHVGQIMGGKPSFGYGSTDLTGQRLAARFVFDHADHGVRIEVSGLGEHRPSDGYAFLDLEDARPSLEELTMEENLEALRVVLARTNKQIADIEETVEKLRQAMEAKGDSK